MAGKHSSYVQPGEWVKGNAIGSGSFGTVHLAMNKNSGELFVVKSAGKSLSGGAGFRALQNEAEILSGLDSPWIVGFVGHEASVDEFNLFMEFMANGSVSDLSAKFGGVLDESVVRSYTREILLGLDYLHRNGIVHCDLKCKNVLLGSCGNIKLADFGCARKLNSHSENSPTSISSSSSSLSCQPPVCGTPLWMAPEVLKMEGQTFESDIWSLGCTIIEMATGKAPWSDEVSSPMGAIYKIACTNDMPALPARFSEVGIDFLRKCLQRDPKLRWTAEELLKHPFVSRKSVSEEEKHLVKPGSNSPTSILDVGLSEGDWESEGSESPGNDRFPIRIPFLTRSWRNRRKDNDETSGNWVVVRSG